MLDVPLSLLSQSRLAVRKSFQNKLHLIPQLGKMFQRKIVVPNVSFNIVCLHTKPKATYRRFVVVASFSLKKEHVYHNCFAS